MADYNLGTARGRVVIESDSSAAKKAKENIDDIGDAAEKAGGKVSTLGSSMDTIASGSLVAGAGIATGLGLAVNAAGDFEFQMSAIEAVTGATADQMVNVSDKAKQLGADTAFSAGEAGAAMEELAKAGIPLEDIINSAADATVALAAAGQVDLAEAAGITAAAMNQFKLDTEDVTGIADLFAGAANASATGVSEIGAAMSQVGPAASAAGLSIEETAEGIALLANNGIDGFKAGTQLRSILTNLQPASDKAATAMEELGLITEDGANKFYNADGSLKDFKDVVDILGSSFEGLSEQQQIAYTKAIFGTESLSAVSAIAGTTAEEFDTLSTAVRGTDATEVAATRMDNMKGSMEQMTGSLETAAITIGEKLLPQVTKIIDQVTVWINKFSALSPATQTLIVKIAAITAGILLAFGATVKIVSSAIKMGKAIYDVGSSIVSATKAIYKFVTAVATKGVAIAKDLILTARIQAMYAKDFVIAMAKSIAGVVASTASWVANTAAMFAQKAAMLAVRGAMIVATAAQWLWNAALTANPIGIIIAAVAALVAGLIWFFTQTEIGRKIFAAAWAGIQAAVSAVVDFFMNTVVPIFQAVWTAITTAVMAVVDFFTTNILPAFQAIGEFIGAVFGLVWDLIQLYFQFIMAIVQTVVDFFLTTILPAIQSFVDGIIGFFVGLWEKIVEIWTAVSDFLRGVWDAIYAFVKSIVMKVVNFVISYYTTMWNIIVTIFTGIWNFLKGIWDTVYGFISGIVTNIKDAVVTAFTTMKDKASDIIDGIKKSIEDKWNAAYEFITGIKDKIVDFFKGAKDWLVDAGKKVIDGLLDGLKKAAEKVTSFFTNLTDKIPDLKGPAERDAKLLTDNGRLIMQSLIDGFEGSYGDVEKSLQGLTDTIPTSVTTDIEASLTGSGVLAALSAGAARTTKLVYNAAPGSGQVSGEDELINAMRRSRVLIPGWGG